MIPSAFTSHGLTFAKPSKSACNEKSDCLIRRLAKYSGLLVPGGFGTRGVEGKIAALNWARLGVDSNRLSGEKWHKIPTLGICLGFQCQVIEFARNVLGVDGADSVEFATDRKQTLNPTQQVIVDMPEHNGGDLGGTQRLGARTTRFVDAVINETDPPSLQRPLSILCKGGPREEEWIWTNFARIFIFIFCRSVVRSQCHHR